MTPETFAFATGSISLLIAFTSLAIVMRNMRRDDGKISRDDVRSDLRQVREQRDDARKDCQILEGENQRLKQQVDVLTVERLRFLTNWERELQRRLAYEARLGIVPKDESRGNDDD